MRKLKKNAPKNWKWYSPLDHFANAKLPFQTQIALVNQAFAHTVFSVSGNNMSYTEPVSTQPAFPARSDELRLVTGADFVPSGVVASFFRAVHTLGGIYLISCTSKFDQRLKLAFWLNEILSISNLSESMSASYADKPFNYYWHNSTPTLIEVVYNFDLAQMKSVISHTRVSFLVLLTQTRNKCSVLATLHKYATRSCLKNCRVVQRITQLTLLDRSQSASATFSRLLTGLFATSVESLFDRDPKRFL